MSSWRVLEDSRFCVCWINLSFNFAACTVLVEHCRKVATYLASRERDLSDMAPKERCSSALLRCPGQLEGRRGHLALQGRLQRTLLQVRTRPAPSAVPTAAGGPAPFRPAPPPFIRTTPLLSPRPFHPGPAPPRPFLPAGSRVVPAAPPLPWARGRGGSLPRSRPGASLRPSLPRRAAAVSHDGGGGRSSPLHTAPLARAHRRPHRSTAGAGPAPHAGERSRPLCTVPGREQRLSPGPPAAPGLRAGSRAPSWPRPSAGTHHRGSPHARGSPHPRARPWPPAERAWAARPWSRRTGTGGALLVFWHHPLRHVAPGLRAAGSQPRNGCVKQFPRQRVLGAVGPLVSPPGGLAQPLVPDRHLGASTRRGVRWMVDFCG